MRQYGKNCLAKIPMTIAAFNLLPNPERFTGHCFRRSAASLLANEGCSLTGLKRAGRWTSDAVVDGYIEVSKKSKLNVSETISGSEGKLTKNNNDTDKNITTIKNITINNCSNIVFNA